MMIRLESLRLRAFRSFVGPVTVKFPETGLVLVKARNCDTGGHSGAGKTNLLLGLAYAFDHAPVAATLLQRDDMDEPMEVQVALRGEKRAVLTRGAKTSFAVEGEDVVKGSVAAVQKRLQSFVGLPPKLLEALTYRGQRERSMFLSATDEAKKEFLALAIPDLARFETVAEEAEERARAAVGTLKASEAVLEMAKAARDSQKSRLAPPAPRDLEVLKDGVAFATTAQDAATDKVLDLTRSYQQLQLRHEAAINKWSDELAAALGPLAPRPVLDESRLQEQLGLQAECARRIQDLQAQDAKRRAAYQENRNAATEQLLAYERSASREPALRQRVAELEDSIRQLKANSCPTCKRPWEGGGHECVSLEDRLYAAKRDLDGAKLDATSLAVAKQIPLPDFEPDPMIAKLTSAAGKIRETIATERASLDAARRVADAESGKLRAELQAFFANRVKELRESEEATTLVRSLEAARSEESAAKDRLWRCKDALSRAEHEVRTAQALYDQQLRELAAAEEAVVAQQRIHDEAQAAHAKEADLALLVGNQGFLGSIFDEILGEISHETNTILAAIPNTSHVCIRYRSESATKKGTKRTIAPVLTVRSRAAPLKGVLSGGQTTGLELATDLAVGRVISRRTGVVPGWLIFDESFEGLGLVEKEGALEMLAEHARDRCVLIVDHDNAFKEMFTSTIDLEFRDGITTVREEAA